MQPLTNPGVSSGTQNPFGINTRTNSTEFVPEARKTRAFAYLRVSGKGQIDGDGFRRQLEAIRQYSKASGIRIAGTYREKGVCGATDAEDRPAWVEMVGGMLSDGVKTVVIERLDRLARDLLVQEHIVADLRRRGLTLVSVYEPDLCSDDPTRVLMRQVIGAVAQYDKAMTVLKLRAARSRRRKTAGRCEGRKPYGTRPGETEVVGRMQDLRATGLSFERVAEMLNGEGLKPRQGDRWHGVVCNRILSGHRAGVSR